MSAAGTAEQDPLSKGELVEVRNELESQFSRLRAQVAQDDAALRVDRDAAGVVAAGDDDADVGARLSQRERQTSLVGNAQLLLEQTAVALGRIEAGTYGTCTSCGAGIGTARLRASPRVITCLQCQQQAERRAPAT